MIFWDEIFRVKEENIVCLSEWHAFCLKKVKENIKKINKKIRHQMWINENHENSLVFCRKDASEKWM